MFGKRLSKPDMPKMFIGESDVMWSYDCSYLGIMFFSCSIDDRRRKFYASVNSVISKCNNMSEEVMLHIVQMQCLPILTYGCCAWKISNSDIRKMCVSINNALRRIFRYKKYESVKCLLFYLLPLDKYMMYKKYVLLMFACMWSSEKIVMLFSKWWCRSKEHYHNMEQYRLSSLHYVHMYEKLWQACVEYVNV